MIVFLEIGVTKIGRVVDKLVAFLVLAHLLRPLVNQVSTVDTMTTRILLHVIECCVGQKHYSTST